jgi:hypothetical protein
MLLVLLLVLLLLLLLLLLLVDFMQDELLLGMAVVEMFRHLDVRRWNIMGHGDLHGTCAWAWVSCCGGFQVKLCMLFLQRRMIVLVMSEGCHRSCIADQIDSQFWYPLLIRPYRRAPPKA